MKNFDQNKVKAKPVKRTFLIIITLFALIAGMFFSTQYIVNNPKVGFEYGKSVQVLVQVKNNNSETTTLSEQNLAELEENIYNRLNILGLKTPQITREKIDGQDFMRITEPGIDTEKDADIFVNKLTEKSRLSLYNVKDQALFNRSGFDPTLSQNLPVKEQIDIVEPNSAQYTQHRSASSLLNTISFEFNKNNNAHNAYSAAAEYLAKQPPEENANQMVFWVNRDGLQNLGETVYQKEWEEAGKNLYNFAHVYKDGEITTELKTTPFNASEYLIATSVVNPKLTGNTVFVPNSFKPSDAKAIAAQINYGSSPYDLIKRGTYSFVGSSYGEQAVNRIFIAMIIIIALIVIFLIGRYGLLGAITGFAFLIFIILSLLIFTALNGEYTSWILAALILGIGLMLETSISTFERIKTEVYSGKNFRRSLKLANKQSNTILFDSSFMILILSFVLFYGGTLMIPGFSGLLIISIFTAILLLFIFIRVFAWIFVRLKMFENKPYLVGNSLRYKERFLNQSEKFETINYSKKSKLSLLISGAFIGVGITVFGAMAGTSGALSGGFNSSLNLTGGNQLLVSKEETLDKKTHSLSFTDSELNKIITILNQNGINKTAIEEMYANPEETNVNGLKVEIESGFDTQTIVNDINNLTPDTTLNDAHFLANNAAVSNPLSRKLLINTVIVILLMILAAFLYMFFRFRWTFAITGLVSALHDILMVGALFAITRLPFDATFSAGLFVVIFYSLSNKFILFEQIRSTINSDLKITDPNQYKTIINQSIGQIMRKNIVMMLVMVGMSLIVLIVPGDGSLSLGLVILAGVIISFASTILIVPLIWIKLEKTRFKVITKNQKNDFWKTPGPEEQVFSGINDIKGV